MCLCLSPSWLSVIVSQHTGLQYIDFSAEKGKILVAVPEPSPVPQPVGQSNLLLTDAPFLPGVQMKPVQDTPAAEQHQSFPRRLEQSASRALLQTRVTFSIGCAGLAGR